MQDEKDGLVDLYYFDESGFSLVPEVPYAWQDKGTQICLPSSKSKRINVVGFMNKDSGLTPFVFESSVTSEVVVACFDSFAESITKQTIVVIDNASIHHSELFNSKIGDWEKKNIFLLYLPPYSPELNKIEILWKHIKYYWLSFDAYKNFESLRENLNDVLCNVGRKHRINFV